MKPIILYDNKLTNCTITATTTEPNYSPDYLADYKTFTKWKAQSGGTNYIKVAFGSSTFFGAFAIANHNLYDISASISLQKSSDNSNWIDVVSPFKPSHSGAILKIITTLGQDELQYLQGGSIQLLQGGTLHSLGSDDFKAKYWRFKIVSDSAPELAVLFAGPFMRFEYPPESPYIPASESINAVSNFSNDGHLLGSSVRYFQKDISAQFKNVSRAWFNNSFNGFWNYAKYLKPFFYAWDLDVRHKDIFYSVLKESSTLQEPLTRLERVDNINLDINVLV